LADQYRGRAGSQHLVHEGRGARARDGGGQHHRVPTRRGQHGSDRSHGWQRSSAARAARQSRALHAVGSEQDCLSGIQELTLFRVPGSGFQVRTRSGSGFGVPRSLFGVQVHDAMTRMISLAIWVLGAAAGAGALGVVALGGGQTISAAWIVIAGVCSYAVAYRFYARFIGHNIFGLDPRRATPAQRRENSRDFVPTTRWVLYGHHFSAISGAGPLVGPTLAAQFGF